MSVKKQIPDLQEHVMIRHEFQFGKDRFLTIIPPRLPPGWDLGLHGDTKVCLRRIII